MMGSLAGLSFHPHYLLLQPLFHLVPRWPQELHALLLRPPIFLLRRWKCIHSLRAMFQPDNVATVYCTLLAQSPYPMQITYVFKQPRVQLRQRTAHRSYSGAALCMWRATVHRIGALKSIESLPFVTAGRSRHRHSRR